MSVAQQKTPPFLVDHVLRLDRRSWPATTEGEPARACLKGVRQPGARDGAVESASCTRAVASPELQVDEQERDEAVPVYPLATRRTRDLTRNGSRSDLLTFGVSVK